MGQVDFEPLAETEQSDLRLQDALDDLVHLLGEGLGELLGADHAVLDEQLPEHHGLGIPRLFDEPLELASRQEAEADQDLAEAQSFRRAVAGRMEDPAFGQADEKVLAERVDPQDSGLASEGEEAQQLRHGHGGGIALESLVGHFESRRLERMRALDRGAPEQLAHEGHPILLAGGLARFLAHGAQHELELSQCVAEVDREETAALGREERQRRLRAEAQALALLDELGEGRERLIGGVDVLHDRKPGMGCEGSALYRPFRRIP